MSESPIKITDDLFYVGVQNASLRVFDIIMFTPYGTSYNSYLLVGKEKVALIETVKERYFDEMLQKIKSVLGDRKIDYVVHNHTEPDHSGGAKKLLKLYPNAKVVASQIGINYLKEMLNDECLENEFIDVETTNQIDLGGYTLEFHNAPFLHWPDSIFTYCKELKTLFPCDFLGCHYSFPEVFDYHLTNEQVQNWFDAFQYYFAAIFGPFKKFAMDGLEIMEKIGDVECVGTSHGPILTKGVLLNRSIQYYNDLSKDYDNKHNDEEVTIAYVSAYGYTEEMAMEIKKGLESEGVAVNIHDCVTTEKDEIIANLQSSKGLIFGTPTILGDALPNIYELTLESLNPIIHMGKVAGSFGSYGWSGEGADNIDERLQQLKFEVPLDPLKVNFKSSEDDLVQCFEYGKNFAKAMMGESLNLRTKKEEIAYDEELEEIFGSSFDGDVHDWKCVVCGFIENCIEPPEKCVSCAATGDIWEIVESLVDVEEPAGVTSTCTVCGYSVDGEHPDTCPVCGASGDIWEVSGVTQDALEGITYTCNVCGYSIEGEHPETCPVCGAFGDIWEISGVEDSGITEEEFAGKCNVCGYNSDVNHDECPVCGVTGEIWEVLGEPEGWICSVCEYTFVGDKLEVCPVCSAAGDIWEKVGKPEKDAVKSKENNYDGRVLVVGGGRAGVSACEAIRNVNEKCEIQLISAEGVPYIRPHISKQMNVLKIFEESWYDENGVELIFDNVSKVNGDNTITGDNGVYSYDKLVLATGSYPLNPYGDQYTNLSNIHGLEDAKVIQNIQDGSNVVIVGGGMIGLELSEFLLNNKKDVNISIIEMAPVIVHNYVADETGCRFFERAVRDCGIDLRLSSGVKNFNVEEGAIISVELSDDDVIECDAVFLAISTRPKIIDIDESLGVELCPKSGAILVNNKMETTNGDIFAAGACTSTNGFAINNWEFSTKQGITAGLNSVGENDVCDAGIVNFSCNGFGTNIFTVDDSKYIFGLKSLDSIMQETDEYFLRFFYDENDIVRSIKSVANESILSPLVLSRCLDRNIHTILKGIKRFVK